MAIRAEKSIAEERRRNRRSKARKEGKKASAKSLVLDGWHIMVTNINRTQLSVEELAELYSVRWQVEITFRAWKQAGQLEKALNRKSNSLHLSTLIYASILWLVMNMKTAAVIQSQQKEAAKKLSIEKLIDDMSDYMIILTDIRKLLEYVPYPPHITMESRTRQPLISTGIKCLS